MQQNLYSAWDVVSVNKWYPILCHYSITIIRLQRRLSVIKIKIKQKETHRHRKQTYGYQRGKGEGGGINEDWD